MLVAPKSAQAQGLHDMGFLPLSLRLSRAHCFVLASPRQRAEAELMPEHAGSPESVCAVSLLAAHQAALYKGL